MVKVYRRKSYGSRYRRKGMARRIRRSRRYAPRRRFVRSPRPRFAKRYRAKQMLVKRDGPNSSKSWCKISGRRPTRWLSNLLKQVVQPQILTTNLGGTIGSVTSGLQSITPFAFLTKTTLTQMETAANNGIATADSVRLFIKTGKHTLSLRNNTNNITHITLYDIITKRDPPSITLDTPSEAWSVGVTDAGGATLSATVGQTPFKSPEFREYYRVTNAKSFTLEAGEQHLHIVHHKYNKAVSTVRFQNAAGLTCSGFTRWILVVNYGGTVHDAATPALVAPSTTSLDFVMSQEVSFGYIRQTQPLYTNVNNLSPAVITPNFMGETDDGDINLVTA